MGAWSVEPSHRVGAFHLGMGVNEALAVVQKMGSLDFAEFNFDEQRPFAADLVLRLPSWGLQLCFDPYQQDLRLISVRLLPEDAGVSEPEAPEASLLPELTYSGQTLGNPPNLREVYQMFGPTWIGDFRREKAAYLLRYPGLAFEFPLPEDMVDKLAAKGEHPMDLAGRPTPSACWMWVYAAQASLQSPRSVVPIEAVQVSPGKGIRLQGRKLLFGAMPQDVVSDFGPPQQVCVKDVDAFRIHSRTPRSPNLDYYYNYFYLGLDALFDGQTHLLQKIVLHTNPPTHERFSRYTRCFFQLQLQEDSGESEAGGLGKLGSVSKSQLAQLTSLSGKAPCLHMAPESNGDTTKDQSRRQKFVERQKKFHRGSSFLDKALAHENHHRHHEEQKGGVDCGTTFLFTAFGMSSWWVGNAIFAQLPLLVARLPEGQALGTQLSMMAQAGNIFSISYKVIEHHVGAIDAGATVNGMHQVSLFILMLLAVCWDQQVANASLPLLGLAVLAGGLGCLSDLTYWSLVMRHPPPCTKAVGVGMSLGNLVVLALSVLQISGRDVDSPRFGITTFFVIAACFQLLWGFVTLVIQDKLIHTVAWAASLVSESLGKKLVHWVNPMHEKAVALLRAEEGEEASEEKEHPGPEAEGLPHARLILIFEMVNFLVYAATYTLPSILPFVAAAFPAKSQQCHLLLNMMILQSVGDVSGRMLAPTSRSGPLQRRLPFVGAIVLPTCFAALLRAATDSSVVSEHLSYAQASVVLPVLVLFFFFSRGMLVSAVFLQARGVTNSREAAEHLASTMGFCGQMGALTANVITFTLVSLYHT
ncbi:unnamed protein product [Effrenium voratum]|uniref:Uncharacterized protein n=1 Tax=Effrenium voratum TaxID=2562239 RepID=A0AA36JE02_9DINO|nr:unnamed protein product [Effrenium voratum]